jgi:hypothetical protein
MIRFDFTVSLPGKKRGKNKEKKAMLAHDLQCWNIFTGKLSNLSAA